MTDKTISQILTIRGDLANHAFWGNAIAFVATMIYPYALASGMPVVSRRFFVGSWVLIIALLKDVVYDLLLGKGKADPWDVTFTLLGGFPVFITAHD